MGPDHMAADVRGAPAGGQGEGLGTVCDRQLADGLRPHPRLHSPGGQLRPVRPVPDVHRGVRPLLALQRRVRPRDRRTLTGGDRELFQDRTHIHHHQERFHLTVSLSHVAFCFTYSQE